MSFLEEISSKQPQKQQNQEELKNLNQEPKLKNTTENNEGGEYDDEDDDLKDFDTKGTYNTETARRTTASSDAGMRN